jgi:hypothetical protein
VFCFCFAFFALLFLRGGGGQTITSSLCAEKVAGQGLRCLQIDVKICKYFFAKFYFEVAFYLIGAHTMRLSC